MNEIHFTETELRYLSTELTRDIGIIEALMDEHSDDLKSLKSFGKLHEVGTNILGKVSQTIAELEAQND